MFNLLILWTIRILIYAFMLSGNIVFELYLVTLCDECVRKFDYILYIGLYVC